MAACNLCGGTAWETLEEAAAARVVRCACGLVFVTPQPDRSTIERAYGPEYYSPWQEQAALRASIWRRRLEDVEAIRPPPGHLLDVGCGTGVFLRCARERGWRVTGTELSAYACQEARREGIPVLQGELWEVGVPTASCDVVTAWHVVEHVGDPKRLMQECHRVLKPGGWLLLATPNMDDHLFRIAYWLARGHRPPLYEPKERELHLFYFSPRTLRTLLQSTGFHDVSISFDRGAAAVWSKRAVNELAYVWFRLTGVNWGMALTGVARKP